MPTVPTRIVTNGSTKISTGTSYMGYARFQQSSSRRFEAQGSSTAQASGSSREIGVFTKNFGDSQGSSRRKEFTNHGDSKAQDKCRAISKWIEEIQKGKN